MHGQNKAKAIAHLMELTVRAAFASDALRERQITDWPALRYFLKLATRVERGTVWPITWALLLKQPT